MFTEIFDSSLESRLLAPEASLALLFWQMVRGARDIPREEDIPRNRLGYLWPDAMILRPTGSDDWIFEHYGRNIALQAGFDMGGRHVSDYQGELRDFYRAQYHQVSQERRPLGTLHRLGLFGERPLWERLVLPIGTETAVSMIFVVHTVREARKDLGQIFARARDRSLIVLQFERSSASEIIDARIIGASMQALALTGRRFDELVGQSMLATFPGLHESGIRDLFAEARGTQGNRTLTLPSVLGGMGGGFRAQIAPYLDGATLDLKPLAA